MLDNDFKLSIKVMKEMGLEEGDRRRVVDQDTGEICCLGAKEIVTPGSQSGKNAVEFDPITNSRMMNKLFGEFVDNLFEEGSIESSCVSYGIIQEKGTNKNIAKAVFDDGTVIKSSPYKNEGLALVDLVFQLNDEEVDLEDYDNVDRSKPAPVKPKTPPIKKKMRKDK